MAAALAARLDAAEAEAADARAAARARAEAAEALAAAAPLALPAENDLSRRVVRAALVPLHRAHKMMTAEARLLKWVGRRGCRCVWGVGLCGCGWGCVGGAVWVWVGRRGCRCGWGCVWVWVGLCGWGGVGGGGAVWVGLRGCRCGWGCVGGAVWVGLCVWGWGWGGCDGSLSLQKHAHEHRNQCDAAHMGMSAGWGLCGALPIRRCSHSCVTAALLSARPQVILSAAAVAARAARRGRGTARHRGGAGGAHLPQQPRVQVGAAASRSGVVGCAKLGNLAVYSYPF